MNSGHKQVKLNGSFLNYIHSLHCITDYPKRGRKRRRRRKRAGGTPNSVVRTDPGSSVPSSHASAAASTSQLSTAPGPSTTSGNAAAPAEDLIDLESPSLMPGEKISGMMATMNITE